MLKDVPKGFVNLHKVELVLLSHLAMYYKEKYKYHETILIWLFAVVCIMLISSWASWSTETWVRVHSHKHGR